MKRSPDRPKQKGVESFPWPFGRGDEEFEDELCDLLTKCVGHPISRANFDLARVKQEEILSQRKASEDLFPPAEAGGLLAQIMVSRRAERRDLSQYVKRGATDGALLRLLLQQNAQQILGLFARYRSSVDRWRQHLQGKMKEVLSDRTLTWAVKSCWPSLENVVTNASIVRTSPPLAESPPVDIPEWTEHVMRQRTIVAECGGSKEDFMKATAGILKSANQWFIEHDLLLSRRTYAGKHDGMSRMHVLVNRIEQRGNAKFVDNNIPFFVARTEFPFYVPMKGMSAGQWDHELDAAIVYRDSIERSLDAYQRFMTVPQINTGKVAHRCCIHALFKRFPIQTDLLAAEEGTTLCEELRHGINSKRAYPQDICFEQISQHAEQFLARHLVPSGTLRRVFLDQNLADLSGLERDNELVLIPTCN